MTTRPSDGGPTASESLGTIVIAAHNEELVLGRTLNHFVGLLAHGSVAVVVACNGCTDRTAIIARELAGAVVLDLPRPSKTAALRAADRIVSPGPRIYLDADIEMTERAAVDTLRALSSGAVAARPVHQFDTTGADWIVRRWYAVREQLPSIADALCGAGCYGLSEGGRARFGEFPEVVADDLFVDTLFTAREISIVATDPLVVRTPRKVGDLVRIMRRSYRTQSIPGLSANEPTPTTKMLSEGQRGQLWDLLTLARQPRWLLDVAVYASVIAYARARARLGPAPRWERDTSSRLPN